MKGNNWWFHRRPDYFFRYKLNKSIILYLIKDWNTHLGMTQWKQKGTNQHQDKCHSVLAGCRLQGVVLTWRTGSVDSSVVVLAEGEIQRLARFGNKLFPGFGGSFPHPAERSSRGTYQVSVCSKYLLHPADRAVRQRERWPFVDLAGELREDLGGAAVVAQLGLDQSSELAHLLDLRHKHISRQLEIKTTFQLTCDDS